MATFTQDEFEDQARIERGYDRFETTSVPFSLDPGFGSLKKAIDVRNSLYSNQTPDRFSVLDGVGAITQRRSGVEATELLEKLVEGQTLKLDGVMPGEILDLLVAKSQEPDADGRAVFYFLSQDKTKILGTLDINNGKLSTRYAILGYSSTEWDQNSVDNINSQPAETFNLDMQGRSEDALFRIECMLQDLEYEKVSEPDFTKGSYTS